jgi:hypothetical protein
MCFIIRDSPRRHRAAGFGCVAEIVYASRDDEFGSFMRLSGAGPGADADNDTDWNCRFADGVTA